MTREEFRTKALDVMEGAYEDALHAGGTVRDTVTAALDALGAAGFKVVGPEVTREMLDASHMRGGYAALFESMALFEAMALAGDLARKPE